MDYSGSDAQLIVNLEAWTHKWEMKDLRKLNAKRMAMNGFKMIMFRMIRSNDETY